MSKFTPPTAARGRNATIEILRYVGAVGIVWFHLGGPVSWIGHAALILFIVISIYFALSQNGLTWKRTRVLELWLVWSAIYLVMKIAQAVMDGKSILTEFEPWMLLTGPVLPLWFLPFIYVATGLASTYRLKVAAPPPWIEGIALSAGILAFMTVLQVSPGVPFAQWCIGFSAVCLALAIYRAKISYIPLGLVMVTLALAVTTGQLGESRLLLLAAPVAIWTFLFAPNWQSDLAEKLGGLALPLYLLHPGLDAVTTLLLPDLEAVTKIVLVIIAATTIGFIMQRTAFLRRFI